MNPGKKTLMHLYGKRIYMSIQNMFEIGAAEWKRTYHESAGRWRDRPVEETLQISQPEALS